MTGKQVAEKLNGNLAQSIQWLMFAAIIPWIIWLTKEVSQTSGNRWTSGDQIQFMQRLDERLSELPPDWFAEKVERIDQRLQTLEVDRMRNNQ